MANEIAGRATATVPKPGLRYPGTEAVAFALLVVFALVAPLVLTEYWIKAIAIPTIIFGLSAFGLNLVTGYAGLISMGQAAFMALGAFTAVITYGRFGLPVPLTILAGGAFAALVGVIVGTPSLRIKGLYLMVATLASQFIIIWVLQRVPWTGTGSFATLNSPPVRLAGWNVSTTIDKYYF